MSIKLVNCAQNIYFQIYWNYVNHMTFQLMMQCAKMIPYLVVTCVLAQYAKGGPITWQRML
jgi:hypothetical protein